jgi:hypothetical protein
MDGWAAKELMEKEKDGKRRGILNKKRCPWVVTSKSMTKNHHTTFKSSSKVITPMKISSTYSAGTGSSKSISWMKK